MERTGAVARFCTQCGHPNPQGDRTCARCGNLMRATLRPTTAPRPIAPPPVWSPSGVPAPTGELVFGFPAGLFHLAVGIPIALVIGLAGPLAYIGWFLGALVHEMGHCAVAFFFGSVAVPAIRLDGHAAAVRSCESSTIALVVIWMAFVALAVHFRHRRGLLMTFAAAAALYPLLAFTRAQDVLHLAGGHLAELAFATLFFWRALTGGFVKSTAERPFYAALGWYWMVGAIVLFGSLAFSEASRQWYLTNGSFGLDNDFVRLARMFRVGLPVAALPMLLLALLPLPLAWWMARRSR
jgi:hypothetical protein